MNFLIDADLVIVRGLPGSGKTRLAKEISRQCGYVHIENSMFLIGGGHYANNFSKMMAVHKSCFKAVEAALLHKQKVVVSNTFIKLKHMNKFRALSNSILVIECAAKKINKQIVPSDVMQSMAAAWEPLEGAVLI